MMKRETGLDNKTILVTGAAGFVGAAVAVRLLGMLKGSLILGVDNMNDYYDPRLKLHRLEGIGEAAKAGSSRWEFMELDIADRQALDEVFSKYRPEIVLNLAAQAGVRNSITNPEVYIRSNINGFFNILECCRSDTELEHLVFASSSSVYGGRKEVPFRETDNVDHPVSLYAATKKSNELLAHSYSKLYGIPVTGLRFFTVYGPQGRPDMAYYSFTEKLVRGETIRIFNYGECERDFTYIDDIVTGVTDILSKAPVADEAPPYDIYNIGNSHPEKLTDFVRILGEELISAGVLDESFDIESHMELVPMQPGDVPVTYADTEKLFRDTGFRPSTDLRTGLRAFARWYQSYTGCSENSR